MESIKTEVLIIGAGPTGLSLACQLVRHGIDFVIIDEKEGPTPFSKAVVVHARTLEIYEQIGLAAPAVEQGAAMGKLSMMGEGELRGQFDLAGIGEGLSPYPFVLMLEQSKNERMLYEFLQSRGHEVRWNTSFESLVQDDASVTAQIRTAGPESQGVEAKYLVGCDGSQSPVRHALNLPFEGSTFERIFYVADVDMESKLSRESLYICLTPETFVLFFPLYGDKHFRIIGVLPEGYEKETGDILYEEMEKRVKAESKLDIDVTNVNWFSSYKVHSRYVSQFSSGRCFLAGDAAHIHSPVGGQGMNTGIQDGYNLAWKLALALRHNADETLLATYNEERHANAKTLIETTDRMFSFVAGSEGFLGFLRTNVLPPVMAKLLSFDSLKRRMFPFLSQIGINYRGGALAEHAGDEHSPVKAGDRMPYFLINGESVYDRLHSPKFHLLTFTNSEHPDPCLSQGLEKKYPGLVVCHTLALSPEVTERFNLAESFNVLLRPDNHIAFLSIDISRSRVEEYLDAIVKPLSVQV